MTATPAATSEVKYDVVAIGNALMDIIGAVPDDFPQAHGITEFYQMVSEDRAVAIEQALGSDVTRTAGGSAANTIAGLAELGLRGGYICKIADGPTGRDFAQSMARDGIVVATDPLVGGPRTGRSIIVVTPDGERRMNTYLGASTLLTKADVDDEMVRAADTLYLEGYLFDTKGSKEAFVHAAEVAKAAGRKVALTTSAKFCVDQHRASFRQLVENQVDILFANEEEALALYETDVIYDVVDRLELAGVLAFITLGEKGSIVVQGNQRHEVAAVPVELVVDTTGAGDQYAAGVLAALAMGMEPEDAARLGSVAASEVIGHFGPRPEASVHGLVVGE